MTFAVRSLRASSPTRRSTASASDSTPRIFPEPLPRKLEQAEARDPADLDPGAIVLHRVAKPILDLALVALRAHVDEVDHDESAQVADSELAADLVRGLEVRVERGFFDVAALGRARRVDVDR